MQLHLPTIISGDTTAASGASLALELLRADLRASRRDERLRRKRATAAALRSSPPALPKGKYDLIVLDPPWQYSTSADRGSTYRGLPGYPDMSLEAIAALPLPSLASEHCALWLWTTNSFIGDAWAIMRTWGFSPKTVLTWFKVRHGVGHYLANVTEHCLLGTQGNPTFDLQGAWHARGADNGYTTSLAQPAPTTLLSAERREHSRKPAEFFLLVEKLCPCSARLEMFAREPRAGWTSWGAETGKFPEAR